MRIRGFILCCLVCLAVSVDGQHLTLKNYQQKSLPRSMATIGEGLYCDSHPISNLDWREYLYWLESSYGKDSESYRAALPDETVARQQLPDSIASNYLWQPVYSQMAVLGVSAEQVRRYCQWRTDRVAEWMLREMKLLNHEQGANDFYLSNYDNPKNLKFLHFFLPQQGMETRYGFICYAEWR